MDSPRLRERVQGFRMLEELPAEADPIIIESLPQLSIRPRLLTLEVLVNRKSSGAAALIIKEVRSPLTPSHMRLVRMLQQTPDGWETLKTELFDNQDGDRRQPQLEAFYYLFIETEVRDHFLFCLQTYQSGYFRAMFDKLWRYGKPALMIMVQIARGEDRRIPDYNLRDGRKLASQALIDWQYSDERKKTILKELEVELVSQRLSTGRTTALKNVRYALHRLGVEQSQITANLSRREVTANRYFSRGEFNNAIWEWSSLAEEHLSLRDNAKAIECFQQCIEVFRKGEPKHRKDTAALAYYNIACLRSLEGNPDSAVSALRQATQLGYTNFEWMWIDRDLENTWSTDEFKNWISELRSQEEWKHRIPERELGTLPEQE